MHPVPPAWRSSKVLGPRMWMRGDCCKGPEVACVTIARLLLLLAPGGGERRGKGEVSTTSFRCYVGNVVVGPGQSCATDHTVTSENSSGNTQKGTERFGTLGLCLGPLGS